jgi:hypothetical protein
MGFLQLIRLAWSLGPEEPRRMRVSGDFLSEPGARPFSMPSS